MKILIETKTELASGGCCKKYQQQAGAELCQAQDKPRLVGL